MFFLFIMQGRQKLALFNAKEFATLIIDILNDARRREQDSNPDLTQGINRCAVFSRLINQLADWLNDSLSVLLADWLTNVLQCS